VVVAIAIIPGHTVSIGRLVPQVQIAICMVVAVRFIVPCAPKPPWRFVGSHPGLLIAVAGIEGMACATTTTILRASDIDDPIWGSKRGSARCKHGGPIATAGWCEQLGATWATVFVTATTNIKAIGALQKRTRAEWTIQGKSFTLACFRAA